MLIAARQEPRVEERLVLERLDSLAFGNILRHVSCQFYQVVNI